MTRRRLSVVVRAALLLVALLVPASAQADEQPAILKAYDLDWIERVRDDAWPQPKAERPVICLLDTGVDITPDTPADNPDGPIVARLALDGGTGTAQGTSWEHQHGTQMASIIAAPRNGYGTVGVFPQARIVSIRVTDSKQDEVYITPQLVARGARRCANWAEEHTSRLAAAVVAESNYSQREADAVLWNDAATRVGVVNGVVVAAVGNDASAITLPPMASPRVVPVIAGDAGGLLCAFSPVSVAAVSFVAPGCQADPWPSGSSQASAVGGAIISAFLTRNPGATTDDALAALIRANSRQFSGASWRPQMAPFIADTIGSPEMPEAGEVAGSQTPAEAQEVRLWRPRVVARFIRGRLRVERRDGRGGQMHVLALGSESTTRKRRLSLKLTRRPKYVSVWVTGTASNWRSLTRRQPVV